VLATEVNLFLVKAREQIETAKYAFGVYTYRDRGPEEVMDVPALAVDMRALGHGDAADAINKMSKESHDMSLLATALLHELEDWDELFDLHEDEITHAY